MLALFAGRDAAHDVGAICDAVFGIARSHSPGESLVDDTGVLAYAEILDGVFISTCSG